MLFYTGPMLLVSTSLLESYQTVSYWKADTSQVAAAASTTRRCTGGALEGYAELTTPDGDVDRFEGEAV